MFIFLVLLYLEVLDGTLGVWKQSAGDNDDPSLRKVIIQGTKEQIARCTEISWQTSCLSYLQIS